MSKRLLLLLRFSTALILAAVLVSAQADQAEIVASGSFVGQSDHITTGAVTIKRTADGVIVELGDDFSLDGAPDPKLGFGSDGYDTSTTFAPLRSNTGSQVYQVPAGIDVSSYNEFYIWCEKFSVPLGVAKLSQ